MRKSQRPVTGIKSNQTLPCLKLVLCAWLRSHGQKLSLVYLHNAEPGDTVIFSSFLAAFFFLFQLGFLHSFFFRATGEEWEASGRCVCVRGPFSHDWMEIQKETKCSPSWLSPETSLANQKGSWWENEAFTRNCIFWPDTGRVWL